MQSQLIALFLAVLTLSTSYASEPAAPLAVRYVEAGSVTVCPDSVSSLLDRCGAYSQTISCVNWPEYDYAPEVNFRIAHTGIEILLEFSITESIVMALTDSDNGKIYNDSCVEFFLEPDSDGNYYNFECNCIGALLMQAGQWHTCRELADAEIMHTIGRYSTLGTTAFAERPGACSWQLCLVIPAKALYLSNLDTLSGRTMKANFYKCGNGLSRPHYLSWQPVSSPRPAFHVRESFAPIYFENPIY